MFTGTLTRPNVIVPDHNGRMPDRSGASSSFFFVAFLGSFFLLLFLERCYASGQNLIKRSRSSFRLNRSKLRLFTLRLLLDETHHTLAILVFELLSVKIAFEKFDQLTSHRNFFFV